MVIKPNSFIIIFIIIIIIIITIRFAARDMWGQWKPGLNNSMRIPLEDWKTPTWTLSLPDTLTRIVSQMDPAVYVGALICYINTMTSIYSFIL